MEDLDKENDIDRATDLPSTINSLKLEQQTQDLVSDILKEDNIDNLKKLTELFNVAQAKKNALRIVKLSTLLGKVDDEAINRFENHPEEATNREIMDYMQIVQNQIDKANATLQTLDDKPLIQITNQKNEVNIINNNFTRENRDNVIDAVKALLQTIQPNASTQEDNSIIIDAEEVENNDN